MKTDPGTCIDCTHGTYHPSKPGDLERPPEPPYCECRHPRVLREAVYDPARPPAEFRCRFWLDEAIPSGTDDAAMDAEVLPFAEWRELYCAA